MDLRGFGDSEKPAGISQYHIKYIVSDVQNLIKELGKIFQIEINRYEWFHHAAPLNLRDGNCNLQEEKNVFLLPTIGVPSSVTTSC